MEVLRRARGGAALALELGHDDLVGVPSVHSRGEKTVHLLEAVRRAEGE